MSDYEEDHHEDVDVEGAGERGDEERQRAKHTANNEEPKEEKTEAQLMIEAKQRKHEEEEAARLLELEEQRRIQRLKEEEELRQLKEKQAQRKKEREEEERRLEEQRIALEEQRKREEEQRRLEKEAEKQRKLEEAERKKAAATAAIAGGRNFVIEKTGSSSIDKFTNISQAKSEMGMNTHELEALRHRTLHERLSPLAIEGMDAKALKAKAEELWKRIYQLEAGVYDLEERHKRQEYDLKELNERQRQINQKKYVAAGLSTDGDSRHPPKVQIISKYERRTDRRTFGDRRVLFEAPKEEEKKEFVKPKVVRRENWIKTKEEEAKRGSHEDEDHHENHDENQYGRQESNYSSHNDHHQEEEEVAAEEEEE